MRFCLLVVVAMLAACGPRLPAPNSADVQYDGRQQAVQVRVSSLQPPSAVALVAPDGRRFPAAGIALMSGCSAFGSGVGVGVPVGQPTPAEISDQYVASALIPVPPDYVTNWSQFHVEISAGGQAMNFAAPNPTG